MKAEETFQLQQLKDVTQSEEANPICPKFLVLKKEVKRRERKSQRNQNFWTLHALLLNSTVSIKKDAEKKQENEGGKADGK